MVMLKNASDIELWNALRKGNREALAILFERYYFLLTQSGTLLSNDFELARDIIHEVFYSLWEKRARLNPVTEVRAYLTTIYRHEIQRAAGKRQKENIQAQSFSAQHTIHEASYEEIIVSLQKNEEIKSKIRIALQELTPRQKEFLQLKFFEGLSYEQIAEKTGQSIKTIYNTTYEALKMLRKKVSF